MIYYFHQLQNRVGPWNLRGDGLIPSRATTKAKYSTDGFINSHFSLFHLIPMLLIRSKAPSRLRKCVSPFEPVIMRSSRIHQQSEDHLLLYPLSLSDCRTRRYTEDKSSLVNFPPPFNWVNKSSAVGNECSGTYKTGLTVTL